MFDMLFATYKSMMTVLTLRVDTAPKYSTISILICVHSVSVCSKYNDDISVLAPTLVRALPLGLGL